MQSNEALSDRNWREWHLTPRGWQRGSERMAGRDPVQVEPPPDRVRSIRRELAPDGVWRTVSSTWDSGDFDRMRLLHDAFGAEPVDAE